MKEILTVLILTCVTLPALQAQRLKKPRQQTKKAVTENMYKSAVYAALEKLLGTPHYEEALELTSQLLTNYSDGGVYGCNLNFIAGNLYYASKEYEKAYAHYEAARVLGDGQSGVYNHLNDAANRTMYRIEQVKIEATKKAAKEAAAATKHHESNETAAEADTAFAVIEKVLVYSGCDGSKPNMDLKTCMSTGITTHINQTFNVNLATQLNLNGKHKILVSFTIAKTGEVTNVTADGNQPNLELEAIRTIRSLPDMKPGMQRGKPVGVIYGLPILFMVQ